MSVRLGGWIAVATAGAALGLSAPAGADTLQTPGDPGISPDPPTATGFADTGAALVLTRPVSARAPGYTLTIAKAPFEITTARDGRTVLATTGDSAVTAAARFVSGGTAYYATRVSAASWRGGVLTLDLATTDPGHDVAYSITPKADRYAIHWR